MENRRRHKFDNHRRSQNKKPPRGACSWQRTVPSWEKEFCKVIGSLDWETLLQMKKFTHLYDNVIKWNDSAGEEAFSNAKKRFWAEINGLPCNISLPDPDLYNDKIDWDSETDPELQPDLEFEPIISSNADEDHDPVVIFGNSLLPNQAYALTGWGDDDENFKVPANSSSTNHGSAWVQNWGNSFDTEATIGWPGYSGNAWQFGDGSGPAGYMTWGSGWNNDWGWNYSNNNKIYEVQPEIEHKMADGEQGQWNDSNFERVNGGRYPSNDKTSRVQGNDRYRNNNINGRHKTTYWGQQSTVDKRPNAREWNSFNSCGPANHHAAITVGQTWNQ